MYHHVVATKDGAGVKIYIDGVENTVQISQQTIQNSTSPLTFGSAGSGEASFDELALYDNALSAAQVAEHHSAGIGA